MDLFSIWHWLIVAVIVMLLFGKGKISDVMGDVAQGIKAFKKGMAEDHATDGTAPTYKSEEPPKAVEGPDPHAAQIDEAVQRTESAHN